jgi:hypothetical protein
MRFSDAIKVLALMTEFENAANEIGSAGSALTRSAFSATSNAPMLSAA